MKYAKIISLIILIFFNTTASLFAEGFLKTKDKKIVDGTGSEILLRGIGLGGWLVQEGYMLGTSSFANAEHEIKSKIKELLTDAQFDQYYAKYYENYVTEADIDKIAEWGFNSIRLPMHYDKLTPRDKPGEYIEEGFQTIDALLNWCKKNELYLILDLHAAPGGQSDEPISDYDSRYPSLWESEVNKQRTIDLWRTIAERYADEEWIGGYDLINEPKWELGENNEQLRDLYVRITNAIREVDTNHIVFIEGNWFATTFDGLENPWDNNMVYSFHKYWNENDAGAIGYLLTLRNQQNVPLWLGESGENSNAWFRDCIKLMEDNNIGWAWWPHKKISSIAGPLSAVKSDKYDYLLKYWNGEVSKPMNTYAYLALMEQAENLKIENCIEQKGVIDAMFRQISDPTSKPFKEHKIPGIIFCTEYDFGAKGYAYADADYENIRGTDWNSGWSFRNDGVDIEECSDDITNGYNVGWVNSSEWMKYTVNIEETGTYAVSIRIAGYSNNGKARIKLNDISITNYVDLPVTNGWQTWQTVTLGEVELPKGTNTISVQFFGKDFNVNYLDFSLITSVENDESFMIKDNLQNNYPNPFNSQSTIKYTLEKNAFTNISIYNTLGELVDTIVNSEHLKGEYAVNWNAENLNSGIYYILMNTNSGYRSAVKTILLK